MNWFSANRIIIEKETNICKSIFFLLKKILFKKKGRVSAIEKLMWEIYFLRPLKGLYLALNGCKTILVIFNGADKGIIINSSK